MCLLHKFIQGKRDVTIGRDANAPSTNVNS